MKPQLLFSLTAYSWGRCGVGRQPTASSQFTPWVFPLILASWMYSDVPATNVFGSDARRMIAAFDDRPAMRRMLYAKNLVVMTLVVPIATTIAIVVAVHLHRPVVAVWNIALVVLVPLGALGISGWFGIYYPYHPIPLKQRWEQRKPFWHMIVRWRPCRVWVAVVLWIFGHHFALRLAIRREAQLIEYLSDPNNG